MTELTRHTTHRSGPAPPAEGRIDTQALKQRHPIEDVVGGYGIDLRGGGRALVGRCPFHDDRGRPNLHIYPATESYFCYRCRIGGDAIDFVERYDGVGFRAAVASIMGQAPAAAGRRPVSGARPRPRPRAAHGSRAAATAARPLDPEERAVLKAAVDVYHRALLEDPEALAYVERRGLDRPTVERYRLGYATGRNLAAYLASAGLSTAAARRVGLLRAGGCELLAGRVILPEVRSGQPVWMIGRALRDNTTLRYLGLPGDKPVMGWDGAMEAAECGAALVVVEGPFDWLVLQRWGIPAVALVGTYVRPDIVEALARLGRLYLLFDADEPGQEASGALEEALRRLGCAATPIALPPVTDAKDVADLGTRPDGRELFVGAVGAVGRGGDTAVAA